MVNSIGGIFSITMTKTYWFVECPNCPARFSTIVWEKQKVSDATCPSCGFSASSSKKFKYLYKYKNHEERLKELLEKINILSAIKQQAKDETGEDWNKLSKQAKDEYIKWAKANMVN